MSSDLDGALLLGGVGLGGPVAAQGDEHGARRQVDPGLGREQSAAHAAGALVDLDRAVAGLGVAGERAAPV